MTSKFVPPLLDAISYTVEWGAATDNSGSVRYRLFIDEDELAETSNTSYTNPLSLQLEPDKDYRFRVEAFDDSGNTKPCGSVKLSDNEDPVMGPVECEVVSSTAGRLSRWVKRSNMAA